MPRNSRDCRMMPPSLPPVPLFDGRYHHLTVHHSIGNEAWLAGQQRPIHDCEASRFVYLHSCASTEYSPYRSADAGTRRRAMQKHDDMPPAEPQELPNIFSYASPTSFATSRRLTMMI